MAEAVAADKRAAEDDLQGNYKRFKVTVEGEDSKWSLPTSLEEYLKENFEKFIPEKNIKESILAHHPKPENMVPGRKLDCYLQDLLKDKKKSQELVIDATLEKIQSKTDDIMGPLSRLWTSVNNVVTGGTEDEDNRLHVEEALKLIEQTILLIGQSHNTILYERRKNVLSAILPNHQVAATLREKADLLSKDDQYLFGKEFQDHVLETSKARKKSWKPFQSLPIMLQLHRQQVTDQAERTVDCPFDRAPSISNQTEETLVGGEATMVKASTQTLKVSAFRLSKGKVPFNNNLSFPPLMNLDKLSQVHQTVLHMFSHLKVPNVPLAGRLKEFLPAWKILSQDQGILDIVSGFQIPLETNPYQERIPGPIRMDRDREALVDEEVKEMLLKGAIQETSPCKGEFISNVF